MERAGGACPGSWARQLPGWAGSQLMRAIPQKRLQKRHSRKKRSEGDAGAEGAVWRCQHAGVTAEQSTEAQPAAPC